MTEIMTKITGTNFRFNNINPICFYLKNRKNGMQNDFAFVMTILHFLPRTQKDPNISDYCFKLTGKETTKLKEFIKREKNKFLK